MAEPPSRGRGDQQFSCLIPTTIHLAPPGKSQPPGLGHWNLPQEPQPVDQLFPDPESKARWSHAQELPSPGRQNKAYASWIKGRDRGQAPSTLAL